MVARPRWAALARPAGRHERALSPMHQGPLKSQDFVFLRELSRSAHGGVHLARHRASGTPVAIKERRVPELGHGRDLMQEYKVLSTVRHPSVVRCLGHYWGDAGRRALFLVLELADAGDLHTEIRRRRAMRRHFDASTMWSLFSQICAGVAHLHSKGVVHRDIKVRTRPQRPPSLYLCL